MVSIVGASGAGKTTLLHILGTLDTMTEVEGSSLIINGIDVRKLSAKKLAQFRNEHIGFIFQFHQLLPEFTALENVCIPAFIKGTSRVKAVDRAKELLDYLGLSHRLDHKPDMLSGGEQQRVSIARAVAKNPKILLCDEPTGALDYQTGKQVLKILQDMSRQKGATVIIVTHNGALAPIADRVIHMRDATVKSMTINEHPQDIDTLEY